MIKKMERIVDRDTFLKEGRHIPEESHETTTIVSREKFLLDEDLTQSYELTNPIEPFTREKVPVGVRPDVVKKFEDFNDIQHC